MTGQMRVIIIGDGIYRNWSELRLIQSHNTRFADYFHEQWPNSRIVWEGAGSLDCRGYPGKA